MAVGGGRWFIGGGCELEVSAGRDGCSHKPRLVLSAQDPQKPSDQ